MRGRESISFLCYNNHITWVTNFKIFHFPLFFYHSPSNQAGSKRLINNTTFIIIVVIIIIITKINKLKQIIESNQHPIKLTRNQNLQTPPPKIATFVSQIAGWKDQATGTREFPYSISSGLKKYIYSNEQQKGKTGEGEGERESTEKSAQRGNYVR